MYLPKNDDIYKKLTYLEDQPILSEEKDKFNYINFIDTIEDILDNSPSPINIGLFGKWGVGKSSILNLLDERLKARNDIKFIVIDAWHISPKYLKQEFLLEINHSFNAFEEEKFLTRLVSAKEMEQLETEKIAFKMRLRAFLKKAGIPMIFFLFQAFR